MQGGLLVVYDSSRRHGGEKRSEMKHVIILLFSDYQNYLRLVILSKNIVRHSY